MSVGDDKARNKGKKTGNKGQEVKGKAKETIGRLSGNEKLETEGKTDQRKSKLKQAGNQAKDAFKK